MKPRLLLVALGAALLSHSPSSWAQAFLSDPRLTEGQGVKAGDFELHPGVAGEGGYDSNYFQRAGYNQGPPQRVQEDPDIAFWRLRLTPSLSFRNYGPRASEGTGTAQPSVLLNGQLAASYNALFATDSSPPGVGDVSNQNNVAGIASLGAQILPRSVIGFDIGGNYTRMIDASNDPEIANAFRRDVIGARAGVTWRPGGGLFSWRFGYAFLANLFEEDVFQGYNNINNKVETQGTWRFLPRTALVYRGSVNWVHFTNDPLTLSDGRVFNSQIGINGLFTSYFGFLALAGWGATFYDTKPVSPGNPNGLPAQNFDSFTGQAEVTWYPSPQKELPQGEKPLGLSSVALGYNRNFATAYLGNYYARDRGYIGAVYFIGDRLALSLTGGFSHITRPLAFFPNGAVRIGSDQGDNRIDMIAFVEYRLASSFGIYGTFRYDTVLNHALVQLSQGSDLYDDLKFTRYQAYGGLRWFL